MPKLYVINVIKSSDGSVAQNHVGVKFDDFSKVMLKKYKKGTLP